MFRIERFKYVISIVINMIKGFIGNILLVFAILIGLSSYAFAAGGGGGGSSSSGLGFGSRDSVYILVNQDYSEKFSLKNGTKYNLKVSVVNMTATLNFGSMAFQLKEGDNFIDLNENNLADINFNLIDVKAKVANIRIINEKDVRELPETNKKISEKSMAEVKKDDTDSDEAKLKCGNLGTLKERISCRLGLEKDEQEKELELYYLPEECRTLSGSARGICIARYKSVQTCWKFPIGDERVSCVKRAMKLGTIQEEKEACNKLTGEEKSTCVRELKNKVYDLIKWHFYDSEERAEDFMNRGLVDKETVTDYIEKTEQNKAKFNEAKTKEQRKDIILAVKKDWQEFAHIVRENLGKKNE